MKKKTWNWLDRPCWRGTCVAGAVFLGVAVVPGNAPAQEPGAGPARTPSAFDRLAALEEAVPEAQQRELPEQQEKERRVSDVIVNPLEGVILFADTRKRLGDEPIEAGYPLPGVQIIDLEPPDPAELQQMIFTKYLGRPARFSDLDNLVRDIIEFYRERDRPMTHVYVPQQEVLDRVIRLAVSEGRLGELSVEHKGPLRGGGILENPARQHYSDHYILGQAIFPEGEIVDAAKIREGLDAINKSPWSRLGERSAHPFRQVTAEFSPGEEIGQTDLTLSLKDNRPIRFFTAYENSGVRALGEHRFILGAVHYNMWGREHQAGVQFITGTDPDAFSGITGNYRMIVPGTKHMLDLFGSYATSEIDVSSGGGVAVIDSTNWAIGFRYSVPLGSIGGDKAPKADAGSMEGEGEGDSWWPVSPGGFGYHHEAAFGVDLKSIESDLIFGGMTASSTPATIFQIVMEYRARQTDPLGETKFLAQAFYSPGNVGSGNDDTSFNSLRALAVSNYVYGRATLQREFPLPYDALFRIEAVGQVSSANLLASEQLGAGGYATVRGYEEREVLGDKGVIARAELLSPPIRVLPLFKLPHRDEFRILGFFDYGFVDVKHPISIPPRGLQSSQTLTSAGVGIRYKLGARVSLRADYGWTFHETGLNIEGKDSRAHVGCLVSF